VGSRTSKVSAGQVAYKKRGYAWDHLNNDILSDLSATAFPGNVQFPTSAQGWVDIHFNGEYSAKRQVVEGNWSSSEDEFVMRMRADAPTNATGIIHPDKPWQVIYYNAFGQGANLIYGLWHGRATRLEHVIEITEMPPGDSEFLTYDFYIESNDATAFVGANHNQRPWAGNTGDAATVEGFSVFLAKGTDSATSRGAVLRTPVCWWENIDGTTTKKNVRIDFVIQPDGLTVKATKYVRRSDIAEALAQGSVYRADATFNPDADPETTTMDCMVGRTNKTETWATIIAGAGDYGYDQYNPRTMGTLGNPTTDRWSSVWHNGYGFDLSSIGAGQQIDSATFSLWANKNYGGSSSLGASNNIYAFTPASNTAVATSDYANVGSVPFSTPRLMDDEPATSTQVDRVLNAAGLAYLPVDGVANIAFALVEAVETMTSPTWANQNVAISNKHAENAGTSNDPLLTVTHSAAATGSPHYYYQNTQGAI
jgi:hypothetical protein